MTSPKQLSLFGGSAAQPADADGGTDLDKPAVPGTSADTRGRDASHQRGDSVGDTSAHPSILPPTTDKLEEANTHRAGDIEGVSARERGFDGGSLWGALGISRWRVEGAVPRTDAGAVAAVLPRTVRMGTSSWAFPGWRGIVYRQEYDRRLLAQEGLAGYARHPLLRAVGVDRAYYRPVDASTFSELNEQVPDDFRFLVKAWDRIVTPVFPRHPRYGARAGERNPDFLSVPLARQQVIEPALRGLGHKLGVLLWQFAPMPPEQVGGPDAFADSLNRFLCALGTDIPHAVEIRSRGLLGPSYARALAESGAEACLVVHPSMPPLSVQRSVVGPARAHRVIRWMLQRGMTYEAAKAGFAPFNRLAAADPDGRESVVEAMLEAASDGREVTVIINNKAEGSAPLSVAELARLAASRLNRDNGF